MTLLYLILLSLLQQHWGILSVPMSPTDIVHPHKATAALAVAFGFCSF